MLLRSGFKRSNENYWINYEKLEIYVGFQWIHHYVTSNGFFSTVNWITEPFEKWTSTSPVIRCLGCMTIWIGGMSVNQTTIWITSRQLSGNQTTIWIKDQFLTIWMKRPISLVIRWWSEKQTIFWPFKYISFYWKAVLFYYRAVPYS